MQEVLLGRLEQRMRALDVPLSITLWNGRRIGAEAGGDVQVTVRSPKVLASMINPTMGNLARYYVEQDLDVEGEARQVIRAAEALSGTPGEPHRRASLLKSVLAHSRRFDSKSIRYHYDVDDDFFGLWLDARRVYSCAYFRRADDTLDIAQEQKLDHICRKLALKPGERFLDIGCGWGALAMHAAERYGVEATGITLSENQHRLANERIAAAGLQDRCRVLLQDYRDAPGEEAYDKIASVGMFEHVGLRNLETYFGVVRRLLKERGLFLNHGITSSDVGNRAVGLGGGEFIGRYVFPTGELPHLHRAIHDMSEQHLEVHDVESLRPHYAKTLGFWSANFERNLDAAVESAGERIARIWRIYLAGCAHAFEQGWVTIYQVLASRQTRPGRTALPLTRDWMYR